MSIAPVWWKPPVATSALRSTSRPRPSACSATCKTDPRERNLPMVVTARRPAFIIAALIAAELTCSLESNMISVALSQLYRQYGDPVKVGWVMTSFLLAAAGTAAIGGRLGDIYGR